MSSKKEALKLATQLRNEEAKIYNYILKRFGVPLIKKHPSQEINIKELLKHANEDNYVDFVRCVENILNTQSPDIGSYQKIKADQFAIDIGEDLKKVRALGHTSQRAIADKFNELSIPSFHGGKWSHNTVKNIIHRRKNLGLE